MRLNGAMGSGETRFPDGFEFGVATSAYQVEGAASIDGKGQSIWDVFSHQLKTIQDGTSGDIGPDHYHHLDEDVALLRQLGVNGYRCSISWTRVQPDGRGALNQAGLDFYDRLFDELLAAGIAPMVSLYDFDLPAAFQVPFKGWLSRETVDYFADYVHQVASRFIDRVDKWVPFYSPNTHALIGHALGEHAPGRVLGMAAFQAGHHMNLAHGRGISALRALGAKQVGTDQNHQLAYAASDSEADQRVAGFVNDLWNHFNVQPILRGTYPASMVDLVGPALLDGDLEEMHQPIDFFGVGYYGPMLVAAAPPGSEVPFEQRPHPNGRPNSLGWSVDPQGMYDMLTYFPKQYPDLPPIYVTENGLPGDVPIADDGSIHDRDRIEYLSDHLKAVAAAMADGVDVRGYYVDSFLDGFYWERGLSSRFGLVHVDFDSLARVPKDSFDWYAKVIANRGC